MKEMGPLLTIPVILVGTGFAFAAAWCWIGGYVAWLIVKDKKPWWLEGKPGASYKSYHIYLYIGMASIINIFWVWQMLRQPGCGGWVEYTCDPIVGNVALLDLGGIGFELIMFFVLTGLYRWYSWREPK